MSTSNFYLSPEWLQFADSDGIAEPTYIPNRESPLLVHHYSPQENNPYYTPGHIFGGRRGYHSSLSTTENLRSLMLNVLDTENEPWTWPFLPIEEALELANLWEGADIYFSGAECFINLTGFNTVDDFVQGLGTSQRRTNFRAEIKKISESPVCFSIKNGQEAQGLTDKLGYLLSQVQQRYGHDHSAEMMASMLKRQLQNLGERAIIFTMENPSGDIIGFNLSYIHGDTLWTRVVGFDYRETDNIPAYTALCFQQPVAYGLANGLCGIELGMESYSAKIRRGAQLRLLFSVGYGAQPKVVDIANFLEQLPKHEKQQVSDHLRALGHL